MKKLSALTLLLLITVITYSQKKTFVRVFDGNKKKIYKGYLEKLSDSSFILSRGDKDFVVPVSRVHTIKLRHSFGHTLLISSLVTGGAFAILGAATANPDEWFGYTAGEGIIAGLIAGGVAGVLPGALIAGTRNRPVFLINQNQSNWVKIKKALETYLPVEYPSQ